MHPFLRDFVVNFILLLRGDDLAVPWHFEPSFLQSWVSIIFQYFLVEFFVAFILELLKFVEPGRLSLLFCRQFHDLVVEEAISKLISDLALGVRQDLTNVSRYQVLDGERQILLDVVVGGFLHPEAVVHSESNRFDLLLKLDVLSFKLSHVEFLDFNQVDDSLVRFGLASHILTQ